MPRLRRIAPLSDEVPAALRDRNDAAWQSAASFKRWCRGNGVDAQPYADYGPLSRLRAAAAAWARLHALTNKYGYPDWGMLHARGVVTTPGLMAERMRNLGLLR